MHDHGLRYAGDITPTQAWDMLSSDSAAQLVDVRTQPEWAFAGLPELTALNRKPLTLSWKFYPTFELNAQFLAQLSTLVPDTSTPLLFLCKTGGRSSDAAAAATAAGYTACYNIAGGFEGDANAERQRGRINGWKATNLPWEQA
ncbi:MAG: sulfurtransferase [Alphaproteobacteria bacterium]|nr:sulfurtransferase [Alphaproteobacteria bacterium]